MRLITDEAYILEVSDLSDADQVVGFFSQNFGTQRGAAKGAKRRFSRYAGQLQPLSKVDVTWAEKGGSSLVRLRSVELIQPAQGLLEDLEGILLACYLAELVLVFAPVSESNPVMFRLLESTVQALRNGVNPNLAARYFEVWILRLTGVFPLPIDCPECGSPFVGGAVLAPLADHLVCTRCGPSVSGTPVDAATLDLLVSIHRFPLAGLDDLRPDGVLLARVERLCGSVRRSFLGHEVRSYRVMKETLG